MRRAFITLLGLWLGLGLLVAAPAGAAEPEHADVRVLIDISGSMKQNDPQNLRRPAMRMLVGLLQPGTKAGVWIFAKYARALVPPRPVDDAWKELARKASNEITSPGQFTNIELVMNKAMHEWEGAPVRRRRHLLLLTDGVVDVSKAPGESQASRERILNSVIPQLRGMQVQVHTIALSANADHDLLERMATETGGWYEQVDSAQQLQRVFLKLFEKAGKPDGLPLSDNKFKVDNTIREATLLLFTPDGSKPPKLTSPSGQVFAKEDAPDGVSWHQDTGYELITLRDPEPGEWSLSAEVDPDNRVMVVTDLKLRVSELPSRIAAGEMIPVSANMANSGHLITRRDFLDLVEVRAETLGEKGLVPQPINDRGHKGDEKAMDGRYGMNLAEPTAQPEVELVLAAESPTFLREFRHVMAVVEPARLDVLHSADKLVARLAVDDAVMRVAGVKAAFWQESADGQRLDLEAATEGDGAYRATLKEKSLPVFVRLEGVTRLGNALAKKLGPVYAPGASPPPVEEKTPEPVKTPEPAPEPEVAPEPAQAEAQQPEAADTAPDEEQAEDDESSSWLLPAIGFVVVNLLLIIGAGVWWWRRRGSDEGDDLDLVEDEGDADSGSDDKSGQEKEA